MKNKDSVWSPEAGVTGGRELPKVGAGNHTQVLQREQVLLMAELSLWTPVFSKMWVLGMNPRQALGTR